MVHSANSIGHWEWSYIKVCESEWVCKLFSLVEVCALQLHLDAHTHTINTVYGSKHTHLELSNHMHEYLQYKCSHVCRRTDTSLPLRWRTWMPAHTNHTYTDCTHTLYFTVIYHRSTLWHWRRSSTAEWMPAWWVQLITETYMNIFILTS